MNQRSFLIGDAGFNRHRKAGMSQLRQSCLALSAPILVFLLLTEQLLPPLPQYLFLSSSMALGTAMAAIIIVLVCLLRATFSAQADLRGPLDTDVGTLLFSLLVAALVLIHSIVADNFQATDYGRCFQSLGLLILLICAGVSLGRVLWECSDRSVAVAVRTSFWVLCLILVLQVAHVQPLSGLREKSIFPFSETSHFALALTPILLYRCVQAPKKAQIWWVLGSFATALLVQSVALLAGCVLVAIACRRLLLLLVPALLLVLIGLPLGLEYFTSRLDFTGSVVNLSNLVYLEGWQLLFEALRNSHFWGVGFQQLGVRGTHVAVADAIHAIAQGDDLNLLDGSFVFAKLGGEFGIFGLILTAAYVVTAARSILVLRKGGGAPAITFAHCLVVAFGVDMFVRGTGYFVQSSLLFVSGVTILFFSHRCDLVYYRRTGHNFWADKYRRSEGPLHAGFQG